MVWPTLNVSRVIVWAAVLNWIQMRKQTEDQQSFVSALCLCTQHDQRPHRHDFPTMGVLLPGTVSQKEPSLKLFNHGILSYQQHK